MIKYTFIISYTFKFNSQKSHRSVNEYIVYSRRKVYKKRAYSFKDIDVKQNSKRDPASMVRLSNISEHIIKCVSHCKPCPVNPSSSLSDNINKSHWTVYICNCITGVSQSVLATDPCEQCICQYAIFRQMHIRFAASQYLMLRKYAFEICVLDHIVQFFPFVTGEGPWQDLDITYCAFDWFIHVMRSSIFYILGYLQPNSLIKSFIRSFNPNLSTYAGHIFISNLIILTYDMMKCIFLRLSCAVKKNNILWIQLLSKLIKENVMSM